MHPPPSYPVPAEQKQQKNETPFEEMFPFPPNSLQPTFKKPSFHLYDQFQNPTISINDDVPPFFSNFPSPFFDELELPLNQIFPTFTLKPANPTLESKDPPKPKPKPKQKSDAPLRRRSLVAAAAPRKRTGKKDRHSKICTAQGIRDRRMRLSLQVARKFFDLQDLLGYDKASKTIEWLFIKSKKAIKDLAADRGEGNGHVSLSESEECDVMSGIEENCSNNEGLKAAAEEEEVGDGDGSSEKKAKKTANAKGSREKARARARCRTEEKMMVKRVEDPSTAAFNGGDLDNQERVASAEYAPLVHQQQSDVGTIEKLLGNSWDPNTNFMGFLGNWDLLSNQASISMAGNPNSIFSATAPDFPQFHQ